MENVEHLIEIQICNMKIDKDNIPEHIAIIMDGNGRWAKKKFLPRTLGHREGMKAVERTLEAAGRIGIKYLTLYAFSTENWRRPKEEVNALMELLATALDKYQQKLQDNKVVLKIIGEYAEFPTKVVEKLEKVTIATADNQGVQLILALNYSGQWDITQAAKKIAEKVKENSLDLLDINDKLIEENLSTNFAPAPDLVIRTSGEQRISNFLLWQSAYAELYFTKQLWPDFGEADLHAAIADYQARERRFGEVK